MRILQLRGRNLASLADEFTVDFDAAPLADAGLFAITGPTGAGKSTVLDAIAVALFDRFPRLPGERGGPEIGGIGANDARGLLRRGAAEGFAEVRFEAQDGRVYTARWEVRRARGRPDGALQRQSMALVGPDGPSPARGKEEVKGEIARLLGLTYDQFRRAVLLAQGEFAGFLRASAADRADLLEKITGTGIYAALSRAAFEEAKEARRAVDALTTRADEVAPLTADVRAALDRRIDEGRAAIDTLRRREEAVRRAVETAAAAGTARERAEEAARAVEAAGDALAPAEAAVERATAALHAAEAAREAWAPRLAEARLAEARHRAAVDARSLLQSTHPTLTRAPAQTVTEAMAAFAEAQAAQTLAAETETLARAALLDDGPARTAREEANRQLDDARRAGEAIERLTSVTAAQADCAARTQASRSRIAVLEAALVRLTPTLPDLAMRAEAGQRLLDHRRLAVGAHAVGLRDLLQPELPCPVCGALDHPWAGSSKGPDAAALAALEAEVARHRADHDRVRDEVARLRTEADTRRGQLPALHAEAERLADDVRSLELLLSTVLQPADPTGVPIDWTRHQQSAVAQARTRDAAARADEEAVRRSREAHDRAQTTLRHAMTAGIEADQRLRLAQFDAAARDALGERDRITAGRDVATLETAIQQESAAATLALDRARADHTRRAAARAHARGHADATAEAATRAALDAAAARAALDPDLRTSDTDPAARAATLAIERRQHEDNVAEAMAAVRADDACRLRVAGLATELAAARARAELAARLDDVIGSATGQSFKIYAQALTFRRLLVLANHRLAELTRRYRLAPVEADAGALDVAVIDADMADERRPASSLSGGETFLVSLGLALGLSDLAAHRARIGTLLIDEGFGSLDPDALDVAVGALDALHAGGRQIGVISHVPAMVERIGTQIRVTPRGGGRSTVRVVHGAGG